MGWQLGTSVSFNQWRAAANVGAAHFGQDAKSTHTGPSRACSERHDDLASRYPVMARTYRRARCASLVPLHYPHYGKSLQEVGVPRV